MLGGYKGISFPFRINNRGGVTMSSTSKNNASHIVESIQQIFNTSYLERPMESEVFSRISSLIFEPNSIELQEILKNRIVEDLERMEERVECTTDDISFLVERENGEDILYANITFKVIKYNTAYTAKIKVGGVNE